MAEGKWIEGLNPEMSVVEAARVVLAARFHVVRHFLPLAAEKPYEAIEHVHQLRVGTRRAGAALRVFADWLPKKHRKAAADSLRDIRRAAGDARDWDVFIASLPSSKPLHNATGKPAFDFLLGLGLGERAAAQDHLIEAAASSIEFNEESTALPNRVREPAVPDVMRSFAALGFSQLAPLLSDFTEAVQSNPAEPAELHQLRIRGKRVRYAMEVFAACFAPPLKDVLYPAVEACQESLGGLQDAAVGIERLERVRARTSKVVPDEWPRFQPGVQGMIRGLKTKLRLGQKAFMAWREQWLKLAASHPLESLRTGAT